MGLKKRDKTRISSDSKKTFREEINTYNPKKSEKRGKEKRFCEKLNSYWSKASAQTLNLARASEEEKDFNRRVTSNG